MTTLRASEIIPSEESEPPARRPLVEVTNETDVAVDAQRLEAAVAAALAEIGGRRATVSVAVVDDAAIHALNRRFLEHDYATDVLSFVLEDSPQALEGEIVASIDAARREAADAGWPAEDELLLYVVHGALHLAGFGDRDPAAGAEMRRAEAAVLDRLGVVRSPSDARWRDGGEPTSDEEARAL
jgi:probable rRNA maturation factor